MHTTDTDKTWSVSNCPAAAAPMQSRVFSKALDIFLALLIGVLISALLGEYDAQGYISGIVWLTALCISDGFNGQSLGKRVFHLRTIVVKSSQPCGIFRSITRNLFLLGFVTIIGAIIDAILLHTTDRRIGDYAAGTHVIKATN